jgi:mannose-1-phosphate guanylyltransferase
LHPDPLIRLADWQSLLQKACLLVSVLPDLAEMHAVTNRELFSNTADEYLEVAGAT